VNQLLSVPVNHFATFVVTYLIHSTLWILLMLVARRWWRSASGDARVLMWKSALVVPVVTSMAVTVLDVPHCGVTLPLPEITRHFDQEHSPSQLEARTISPHDLLLDVGEHDTESPNTSQLLGEKQGDAGRGYVNIAGGLSHAEPAVSEYAQIGSASLILFALICLAAGAFGTLRIGIQLLRLRALRRRSVTLDDDSLVSLFNALSEDFGLRNRIAVAQSSEIHGPLTAGIFCPFILVPCDFMGRLSREDYRALFAHELAHVVRRDAIWQLIGQAVCHVFFFQPLNFVARRRLEVDAEFVADEDAARLLGDRPAMAACLARVGEWLTTSSEKQLAPQPLATGMASFRSTLGQRVEALLDSNQHWTRATSLTRIVLVLLLVAMTTATTLFAPRANAKPDNLPSTSEKDESMKRPLATIALLTGLALPAVAQEEKQKEQPQRPPVTKKTADALPETAMRFNGMLVGRLVKKDVEKGMFVMNVDAVPRVWRNSKAESPKSLVGKNITVDGVFGKWLDVLLLVKEGETLECEARHDGGSGLTFPGELLRKVAPFKPGDYPVLPEEFRGFTGAVSGKIVTKNTDLLEVIVEVDRVLDTWKNSTAKKAESIVGKRIMIGGFWQRKEAYHGLKAGNRIEVGLRHIGRQSDHLTVTEFVRKANREGDAPQGRAEADFPARGFMGALVGRLVEKDVEKGTLVLKVDAVPRVWKNNKARNPKALIGQNVEIEGIASRLLDVLLTTKKGETLEVAARHDDGTRLTFPGELFRKVAPYKAEDYPVLPDGFRGFQGAVTAEIVKKDQTMFGLIVKVVAIDRTFEKNRAEKAESIVGKNAILAGFWRRKELYGDLQVGDRIEAGVRHEVAGTDVLSVFEGVRKVGRDRE
jgi:beta-lactamase regulating signal transducer with metallopeptidase domain